MKGTTVGRVDVSCLRGRDRNYGRIEHALPREEGKSHAKESAKPKA
jgi:hypothetical protein